VLVQSWERGVRDPSPLACRLLDTIGRDPGGWLAGLRPALKQTRRQAS
jgi:DNA-binding transcriptional regulator YiaG